VIRTPQDITLDEFHGLGGAAYLHANVMLVSNAFYEAHRVEFLDFGAAYNVRNGGGGPQRLATAVAGLMPAGQDPPLTFPVEDQTHRASLDTPVQLEMTALLALGIGLALAAAIVITLMLRAEQRVHDDDTPTLRALGCSSAQLGAVGAARLLPAAVGATVIALGVALVLSPRYPIGIGRQLELSRGFEANIAVLGVGVLVTSGFILGCSFQFGRPRRPRGDGPSRRSSLAGWLARVGAPVDLVLGAHLAFARARRTRSVPSRQAIAGAAGMVAIAVALGMYVAGANHLYSVPDAHGWRWDAAIGNVNFPLAETTARQLDSDPAIRAMTTIGYGQASVGGLSTEFLAFDPHGTAPPEVTRGRLPRSADEVALGAGLLDKLDAGLGSKVRFSVAGGEFDTGGPATRRNLTVVGRALSPLFGESDISDVGIVTLDAIAAAGGDINPNLALVRLSDGNRQEQLHALERHYTEEIATDTVPAQVVNLHRVTSLPRVGLVLAGLMGIIVLAYVMAVSARIRARDLAVLRALGLPARRIRRILTSESLILAAGVALVGIPIGLLLGTALWTRITEPIGTQSTPVVTPLTWLTVPITLLVAVVAALTSAHRTRHDKLTTLLRVY
jgi:hypothetical protein